MVNFMRYYIFSSTPCSVCLNGKFLNQANGNLSYFECNTYPALLTLTSHLNDCYEINLLLKNKPQKHPNVQIIDLYGNFLLIPTFFKKPKQSYLVLFDQSFEHSNLRVSALIDGHEKLLLCNDFGITHVALKTLDKNSKVKAFLKGDNLFVIITCQLKVEVLMLNICEKPKLIFHQTGNSVEVNEYFITLIKESNLIEISQIHYKLCLQDGSLQTNYIKSNKRFLALDLVPYAFLQAVQYKFEFAHFLHPNLYENRQFIADFLGNYNAIIPLPQNKISSKHYALLINQNAVVLEITLEDGLIQNLCIL